MKIRLNIRFRQFDGYEERGDSGYYDPLNKRKTATIDIDLKDNPLEQMLTLYHEVTHAVFDLILRYEFDHKKRRIRKRSKRQYDELRAQWKTLYVPIIFKGKRRKLEKEEHICQTIEHAIKKIFLKRIPTYFREKFFKKL